MYHISSFQCLSEGLAQSTKCLPEFGSGIESVLQSGTITSAWDWVQMWSSPKQWRKSWWSTVDPGIVILLVYLFWVFIFLPLRWEGLSCAPRQRVSRKRREQQFPMQPPTWESRWSGEATFQLCFNEQVVCSCMSFDEWVFSLKSRRLSFITPSICSTRQDRFSTLDK